MKTTTYQILFTLILFSAILRGQSQSCPKDLEINFHNLYLSETDSLAEEIGKNNNCHLVKDEVYIIKIKNINQNIFKVSESIKEENLFTEQPEIFSDFSLPSYVNFSMPESPDSIDGQNNIKSKDSLDITIELFKKTFLQIKSLTSISEMLDYHKKNCEDTLYTILDKIKVDFNQFKVQADSANTIENYLTDYVISNIIISKDKASSFNEHFKEVKKEMVKEADVNLDTINEQLELLTKDKNLNDLNKRKIKNLNAEKSKWEEYKNEIDHYKTEVDAFLSVINNEDLFKKIYGIMNSRKTFTDSNFTYILPFKAVKDLTTIELKISTDAEITCNAPKNITVKREYWTKKGLKIDFSTGVMINGGNGDFIGNEYENHMVDDSNSIIRKKDAGSRALLSLGAFMHIYSRGTGNIKLAFSPGISTNDEFDGLIYHLGGSLIFGKKNRLIFTSGLSMKSSNILDKNYLLGEEYETSSLPVNPSTLKVFPKLGYFFSLSYNLTSTKSE